MTAQVIRILDMTPEEKAVVPSRRPGWLAVCLSTLAVFLMPGRMGKLWVRTPVLAAGIIYALNLLLSFGWFFVVMVAAYVCLDNRLLDMHGNWHLEAFASVERQVIGEWRAAQHNMNGVEKISASSTVALTAACAFIVPYFALLPFAARPGRNKACLRHVLRAVFLGSSAVHVWGLAVATTFFIVAAVPHELRGLSEYLRALTPVLVVLSGLIVWTAAVLITAVRVDYRKAGDFPERHDPWCDDCGYNLIATDMHSRCPECGRAVEASLGANTRPETDWEKHPSLGNRVAIRAQLKLLMREPRTLFFSMSTLTGQRAAQRWLLYSVTLVGVMAGTTVPMLPFVADTEWSIDLFSGGLALGVVWAVLAMMMVGIETAGIATFSRLRNANTEPRRGVYLAAAAKVTCYSSILMVSWAMLGGLQLLGTVWWYQHPSRGLFHLSIRTEQVLMASSLAMAHIGGLLWYELTVYRGIRCIQYANK